MAKAKDLTGQRFGRLTVLRLNPAPYRAPSGKPTRRWDCRCDCGQEVTILANSLTSGHARSCGCLQREAAERNMEDLTGRRFGRWTVIRRVDLESPTANGVRHGWLCQCDCGTKRIVLSRSLNNGVSKSCGCDTAEKANRRIQEDNVLGRYGGTMVSAIRPDRPANKNSRSGVRGVYWSERDGCWIAKIGFRGRTIHLGRFAMLSDAIQARQSAEDQYFAPVVEAYDAQKD